MRKYNFISGLPRSGSTLLSAILNQNPRFVAGITDPLYDYVKTIDRATEEARGMSSVVDMEDRVRIQRGVFDSYYNGLHDACFNTHRAWTGETSLLQDLFPSYKMIITVRHIPDILNSFEKIHRKNPHTTKPIYNYHDLPNVYERCRMLMGDVPNTTGYVLHPLLQLKQAMCSNEAANHLLFVEYEAIVKSPESTMRKIYNFIGETFYNHNFNELDYRHEKYDSDVRMEGLHTVRSSISTISEPSLLPPDLYHGYSRASSWNNEMKNYKQSLNWIAV